MSEQVRPTRAVRIRRRHEHARAWLGQQISKVAIDIRARLSADDRKQLDAKQKHHRLINARIEGSRVERPAFSQIVRLVALSVSVASTLSWLPGCSSRASKGAPPVQSVPAGTSEKLAASKQPATTSVPPAATPVVQRAAQSEISSPSSALCEALVGGVTFLECTNPPRTRDYPDCRTIGVSTESHECPPRHVVVDITGYPGIAKTIQGDASIVSGHPGNIRVLSREGENLDSNSRGTTLLATIETAPNKPTRMLVGPGLRKYIRSSLLSETKSDASGLVLTDGGLVPIGDGQFIKPP